VKTATAKTKPTRPTFITVDDSQGGFLAYFRATRSHIMQAFGPPSRKTFDKSKTSSEWEPKTPKEEIVSIYDWREDYNESGWRQRKYIVRDSKECQQHNHILIKWHIGGVQPSAAEEIGEALGVPLRDFRRYIKPQEPPEPPKGTREHEAATRRLAEIESDGLATGIFKLPVGDRNPVTLGVNEFDYRRVIATLYKGSVEVFERPSGRHLLRWADYGKSGLSVSSSLTEKTILLAECTRFCGRAYAGLLLSGNSTFPFGLVPFVVDLNDEAKNDGGEFYGRQNYPLLP
jgi:hypothetical protein